jgi:hypothetical protein
MKLPSPKRLFKATKKVLTERLNWWARLGIVLFVLTIGIICLIIFLKPSQSAQNKSFNDALGDLIANIENLQKTTEMPEDVNQNTIAKDLDTYQNHLQSLEKPCNLLITLKQPNSSDAGKAGGERTVGICQDLLTVTTYSSELHRRLRDYLLLSDAPWPKSDSPDFSKRLADVTDVIAKTREKLEYLDNSKVQDPALDELLFQVKFAQDIANKVKQAGDNHEEAAKQAEELRIQLARDRTDFLAARQYFWNNTIGIAQLLKALNGVQGSLQEQSAPIRLQINQ